MHSKILTIIAATLLSIGAFAQQIPSLELKDAKGKTVTTASLIDHKTPFAITFWASWCRPCQLELETLADAAPDWKEPVRIYAVCVDDARSVSRARALAASSDWPVTVLYDTNAKFAKAMDVSTIPHAFVFDKEGKRIYSHTGFIPGDENTLIETLTGAK
ncbi:MAG: TlpA family protein disulfide reductase [Bacteroidales bacterium]|nr:TlpA family protein disulfide reductase [Bacteroidales bacterium]